MTALHEPQVLMPLSREVVEALLHELPRADGFAPAMGIIDAAREQVLGCGMLSVNLLDGEADGGGERRIVLCRAWSSEPMSYPVGGRKIKAMTPWTRRLIERAEAFVGEGAQALRVAFDDHGLLESLGLRCVVNVPLLDAAGQYFASVNVAAQRERWRPGEVVFIRLLAALAWPCIERHARQLPDADQGALGSEKRR